MPAKGRQKSAIHAKRGNSRRRLKAGRTGAMTTARRLKETWRIWHDFAATPYKRARLHFGCGLRCFCPWTFEFGAWRGGHICGKGAPAIYLFWEDPGAIAEADTTDRSGGSALLVAGVGSPVNSHEQDAHATETRPPPPDLCVAVFAWHWLGACTGDGANAWLCSMTPPQGFPFRISDFGFRNPHSAFRNG